MGPESRFDPPCAAERRRIFSLTSLLAACGQQAANEAAGSTSSGAPGEDCFGNCCGYRFVFGLNSPESGHYPRLLGWLQGTRRRVTVGLTRMALHRMSPSPRIEKYPETQEGALDMMNDWTISR